MPTVELHFDDRAERVWQVIDPSTESLLDEGLCAEPDLRVALPEGDGAYRVQVASVNQRSRFTFIDAQVTQGVIVAQPPRKTSAAAMRWKRFFRAVPKAFLYPVRSVAENHTLMRSMVRSPTIMLEYRSFVKKLVFPLDILPMNLVIAG